MDNRYLLQVTIMRWAIRTSTKAFPLKYLNEEGWYGTLEVPTYWSPEIFILPKNQDGTIIEEWGNDRVFDLFKNGIDEYQSVDTWNHAGQYPKCFLYCTIPASVVEGDKPPSKSKPVKHCTHIFKAKAPFLKKNEVLCRMGSGDEFGDWTPGKAIPMEADGPWWVARLDLSGEHFPIAYKYGIFNIKHKGFIRHEDGQNRILHGDGVKNKVTILHDGFANLPNTGWKGAGVAIPVFSLKSKDSFGVGEFNDLKLLVDWARKTGLKLIQILPINDTTATHSWKDSYPYAAISAFALHPIYLNLEKVAGKEFIHLVKPLKKKQKQLNELKELDYGQVITFKTSVIKEIFLAQKENS
jgi:4-alpha-glucanotransferase